MRAAREMTEMRRVECEWGIDGAAHLAWSCGVIVVIDVLSFSTAVDVATNRGALVFPYGQRDEALDAYAAANGAELAGRRGSGAPYTLSPSDLTAIAAGTRLMLPSPNGSTIARAVAAPVVFAGCLRNAAAVAAAAMACAGDIGIVPAGERWPGGTLRPAIEDLLGAGAIIGGLDLALSAEAAAARAAFAALRDRIPAVLRGALSGRELIDAGYAQDVEFAAALDVSDAAPRLAEGAFRA